MRRTGEQETALEHHEVNVSKANEGTGMSETASPSVKFPEDLVFGGYFAPVRIEADVYDLEVEGQIPTALNGAYYKTSADAQYPPMLGKTIYLDGDGMFLMLRMENGHADLKTRYIQTERFRAERAARRSLFGKYRNPYLDDPSVKGVDRGTSNTSAGWHAGKLYALKEDSPPMRMDPNTLETLGYDNFDGKLKKKTFTAHPKTDPVTGEYLAFSYNSDGVPSNDVWVYTISPAGELTRTESFEGPYSSMLHDCLFSRNYLIFTFGPMVADEERLKKGDQYWNWKPSLQSKVAVIPRKEGVAGLRWFSCPQAVMEGHTINAWDEDGILYCDHNIYASGWYALFPDLDNPNAIQDPPKVQRWIFDMKSPEDRVEIKTLSPDRGEMPTVDPRFLGSRTRHIYMGCVNPGLGQLPAWGPMGPPFNSVVHINTETGKREYWWAGLDSAPQEPVFIPRNDSAPEGDGYLLAVVDRRKENRSDIVVLDTADMKPIAMIKIPFRLRYGFHGKFVSAKELGW